MFSGWLWSHWQLSCHFNLLIFLMAKWKDLLRADQGTSHNTKLKGRNCQVLKLLVFCLPQEKSTILLYLIVLEVRSLQLVLLGFSEVSTGLGLSGGFRGESISLSFWLPAFLASWSLPHITSPSCFHCHNSHCWLWPFCWQKQVLCDYIGPTRIIQNSLSISKSLIASLPYRVPFTGSGD